MSNLTRNEVKEMGFYELPHFTIGASLLYDLGRNRHLSISSLGTPNEMVFLDELEAATDKMIKHLIVIRNYDYDGPLTREILEMLLKALTVKTGHKAVKEEKVLTHCSGAGQVPLMDGYYVATERYKPFAWVETKDEAKAIIRNQLNIWLWHGPIKFLETEDSQKASSLTPQDFIPLREQYYAEKL